MAGCSGFAVAAKSSLTPVREFRLSGDLLWRVEAHREELEVWEPRETEVVLGRCSCFPEEVREEVAADRVPVSRRRGGGCTVVVGPGVLIFSYRRRGRLPLYPVDWSAGASRALASALGRLGVRGVVWRDGGDLSLGDRKVLGSCLYLAAELMVYGASLLVNPDLSLLERYLRHPPREPDYRRGRSHREFVTSLWEQGYRFSTQQLAWVLGPAAWASWRAYPAGRDPGRLAG